MNFYITQRFKLFLIFALVLQFSGQAQFLKVFKSSPYDQEGQDILPTADGGYLICGYTTNSTINDCDVLLIKSDWFGNELWRKTFGGAKPDFPYHMLATSDGNYFLVGYSQSYGGGDYDILLLKVSPNGDLLWQKTYGGNGNDLARDIIATSDGNYMIVGWSKAAGQPDNNANLIKIDPAGTEIWNKKFGSSADDFGNCIKTTSDGGYIMVGQTYGLGASGGDAWLVKLNSSGDTTWTKRFGGAQNDEGYYLTVAPDGGFVFLVRDSSNAGQDIDVRMIKTDASGTVLWNKVYGGNQKDTPKMVQNTADGGFIVAAISRSFGWINPDMWILKCTSTGDTTWTRHYGGAANEHCYVVREMSDGSYIAVGKAASYGPDFDPIFVKMNSQGTLVVGLEESQDLVGFKVYPNPVRNELSFTVANNSTAKFFIQDVSGRYLNVEFTTHSDLITTDVSHLNSGIYLLTVVSEGRRQTVKIIKNDK